jgi:pimeloyl-ACP methyl ester carboxylesterase
MATIVLVHGGGGGSWIWRWVTPLLRERGHDIYAVTMTGAGDRRHLLTRDVTIETGVADVVNMLEFEDLTESVLVGHSQGGTVLPGVATLVPGRVRSLVFVDAVLLRSGQTIAGAIGLFNDEQCRTLVADVRRGAAPAALDVREQQRGVLNDLDPATDMARVEWMLDRTTDLPALVAANPVEIGIEMISHPARYIACSRTPMTIFHGVAKEMGWPVYKIDSDHGLMVTHPEETAGLLDQIATGRA